MSAERPAAARVGLGSRQVLVRFSPGSHTRVTGCAGVRALRRPGSGLSGAENRPDSDRIQTAPGGGIFPLDFLLSVRLTVHTILLNPFFQSSSSATQPYTSRS